MSEPLFLNAVSIKWLLGLREYRMECGQITTISGGNGSGKTSALEAVKAGIGGGDLGKLKMVGVEDDPEVVLVLNDGALRVERKGSETVVLERVGNTAAYEKVRKPQTFLDSLFDPILSNPLKFLSARPQDRTDILLEVLPLQLDRDALLAAIGDVWPADKKLPEGHALEVLEAARTVLFDERTGVNRSQKDKASSAYELKKELPASMPEDITAEVTAASAARDALFNQISARRAEAEVAEQRALDAARAGNDELGTRIQGDFKATAAKLRGAQETAIGEINAELERAIADLRAKAAEQVAAVKERTDQAVAAEKARAQEAMNAAEAVLEAAEAAASEARRVAYAEAEALQPDLQQLEQRLAELTAQDKNIAKDRRTKALADQFEKDADGLKAVSVGLTKALETVEVFKTQLLSGLPIEGLEIRGKDIFINGVPFDQLNTAQRMRIAVQVATMRAKTKRLPVLFVDGAEALDAQHFELLKAELKATGVQAFMAMVDEGPLVVEVWDGRLRYVTPEPDAPEPAVAGARSGRRRAVTE